MDQLRAFRLADTDHRAMLLVEGVQDALFCEALLDHLGVLDKVLIIEAKGRPNVPGRLKDISMSNNAQSGTVLKLGILQDADQSAESSRSDAIEALHNASLPVPSARPADANAETPAVSVFIAPDNRSQGSLEDLCPSSLTADKVQHLNEYIERMNQSEPRLRPHLVSKVKVALHLATEPAFRKYDRNLSKAVRDNLRPGISIGLAARYYIWDWSRPEFKPVKLFLSRLASV